MDAERIAMMISLFAMSANSFSFQMNKKSYMLLLQLVGGTLFCVLSCLQVEISALSSTPFV